MVFPEATLAGSGSDSQSSIDEALSTIRNAARERQLFVLFGANTWLSSVKKPANWMLVIGPDGQDLLRYEKLYDNHRAAMPGVFEVDGVRCSAAICADRWLRGVVEIPIQNGAQVSFELSNNFADEWVAPYEWYWNTPLAMRNTVWSIFANAANEKAGVATKRIPSDLKHGHSAIISPSGSLAAATRSDTEEFVVADIELAAATRAEATARAAHPALRQFWDAGLALQRGESIRATDFKPLPCEKADIAIAAAPVVDDLSRIVEFIRDARRKQADVVVFPARRGE